MTEHKMNLSQINLITFLVDVREVMDRLQCHTIIY